MARTKVVAILLGPAGIGVVSLYQSLTTMIGTIASLGIPSSGVRELAEACGTEDPKRIATSSRILIRASWFTGILGWLLTAALSYPLSQWTFGTHEHAAAVAIVGVSLLFTTVSGGQTALLQGMRRIGDMARIQILSMVASTIAAIGLYAWLKERGIVPVIIVTAAINYGFCWFYTSKVPIAETPLDWRQTWAGSKRLVTLGMAFMWSALLAAGVAFATRALIIREFGIEANGIFQSAWGISGMFAGFILSAMGTDFYPRLTAVAHDHAVMNRMVNEQTEIGILLSLPGLLGTMVFAPLIMKIFYSAKFVGGAELLPWFVLGIFGRVISWPMGFIQLAKGASRYFAVTETLANVFHFLLVYLLLQYSGLQGAGFAFAILYGVYTLGMLVVSHRLSGFRWSAPAIRLLTISTLLVLAAFVGQYFLKGYVAIAFGSLITISATLVCVRGITSRLDPNHKLVRLITRVPGFGLLCGIR